MIITAKLLKVENIDEKGKGQSRNMRCLALQLLGPWHINRLHKQSKQRLWN